MGIILSRVKDSVFKRSKLGEEEIRLRGLGLSRTEQLVLLMIDGEKTFPQLQQEFADDDAIELEVLLESLLNQFLIEVVVDNKSDIPFSSSSNSSSVQLDGFDSEEFFSSSLDPLSPLHSGSGLVVDTGARSMRSVNLRKKGQGDDCDVDIPLTLELDTNLRLKKDKRRSKLVQVFPVPEKPKRRRRSKRAEPPPVSKWPMRIYISLTVIGVLLLLIALVS